MKLDRNGAAVTCARGIGNPDYLASNGGHIVLTNMVQKVSYVGVSWCVMINSV